jgi:hypothetical protein
MPKGNMLSRLAIASLTAAAVAAPAAVAQPMDMHASTVHKPAAAQQDLRGEAAADSVVKPAKVDLRGEAASDSSRAPISRPAVPGELDLRGEAAADLSGPPSGEPRLAGPPTWPVSPTPLAAPSAAVVADDGDGGIDIPTSVLIIAGALVAAGGLTVAALRLRPRVAH